ncbi:hypothetical protein M2129_002209 [Polynucleobacter sphagniphilus]|uniref:hypothetical protein n=1 Tax=Polynucleobacter sphagniphilus TaxID=1743169 RepID=UPI002475383F|nr:hypothetical protein [Polynucleobacter sphagniphilus]MDH6250199.1 hypothetical protein [Polynucleobacter sphagniphilus]
MFGKIINYFQDASIKSRIKNDPGFQTANELVYVIWTSNKSMTQDFSKKFVSDTAQNILNLCWKILTSPNPLMANREQLCEFTNWCAWYQVLVIDPAPLPDQTGMRGHLGITGEMKGKILEIIKVNEDLQREFHKLGADVNYVTAWDYSLMRYRMFWAYSRVLSGMRYYLKDANPNSENDWYFPFFRSLCAYYENTYRDELGMPSVLDPDRELANKKAGWYLTYLNFVLSDKQYPDLEWEKFYSSFQIENPKSIEQENNSRKI